ncbi:hypothetical protein EDC04DRAFT_3090519 [Pisolithus marmoratus]|nr:hypothetical protein EDC04DRAFT_3090519 [Pisolithus marmoratus]
MFSSRHTTSISSWVTSELITVTPSEMLKTDSGKLGVYCISSMSVSVVCYLDKAGTLTEEGLDILWLIDNVHDLPSVPDQANFFHALATSHSLRLVDGLVVGLALLGERAAPKDPLLSCLVQTVVGPPGSARFRLGDAMKANGKRTLFLELGVIRSLGFVSTLRRMSVLDQGYGNLCQRSA